MQQHNYTYATGRRKTASARVRLFLGKGISAINGKEVELSTAVNEVFRVIGKEGQFHVSAKVTGGGKSAQLEAVRHGIARALLALNPHFRSVLRVGGFLTRDPRMKERKKPGLKRARRAPQWQKR